MFLLVQSFHLELLWMQKVPSDAELEGSLDLQWKQLMQLLLEVLEQPVHAATAGASGAAAGGGGGAFSHNSDPAASR